MGRSGSTLLEFLLDAHPNINIPLESRFIIHLYFKYAKKTTWTKKEKQSFLDDLFKERMISTFWEIDKQQLKIDILNTEGNVSFFELCRIITANYISFFPKEAIKVQGNKNPPFGLWCDILYQLYSQSKFIHLVRNPLDFISSHKKMGDKNLVYFAYRWRLMNTKIEKLKSETPSSFITIKYENLISNPEDTLKKICYFLNINYTPKMLVFNEVLKLQFSKLDPESDKKKWKFIHSHLQNLVNPIDKSNKESWETILTTREIKEMTYITKDVASIFGYDFNDNGRFKIKFFFSKINVFFRHFRNRIYYRLSLSIK